MGKALIIPNVDFTAVALEKITIEEDVPCTGIALDRSTAIINSLDDTIELIPTLTPINTTDAVVWSVSDPTIASVVGGVVTPLKGGSVVVTATCGNFSTSCSVSIHAFIDAKIRYLYYFTEATSTTGNSAVRSQGGADSFTAYGGSISLTDETGQGRYAYGSAGLDGHIYPIALPNEATKLQVVVPNSSVKFAIIWVDSTEGSAFGNDCAKVVQAEGSPWAPTAGSRTVERPNEGEDSFYISVYLNNGLTQDILDQITVEALYD